MARTRRSATTLRSYELKVCRMCPTHQTAKVRGLYYEEVWFCSHACVENYKEVVADEELIVRIPE
jgi:hypothetical protein